MSKILVVPDVHGRDFWKVVKNFEGQIVFLGDYHDPYSFIFNDNGKYEDYYGDEKVRYDIVEGDYKKKSYENFLEIIEFAKSNPNVILLKGNHDLHYIYPEENCSRKDKSRLGVLHNLFEENKNLFVWAKKINNVLFTHAGVNEDWLNYRTGGEDVYNLEALINDSSVDDLMMVSNYRGGWDKFSSPVWMDVHELYNPNVNPVRTFQVFSHTQLPHDGQIIKGYDWACIDSRKVFEIDTSAINPIETLKVWNT